MQRRPAIGRCAPSGLGDALAVSPSHDLLDLIYLVLSGAQNRNRTDDLRITNALLYRLSYLGTLQAQGVMLSVGSDRHDDDSSGGAASGSRPFHWPVES